MSEGEGLGKKRELVGFGNTESIDGVVGVVLERGADPLGLDTEERIDNKVWGVSLPL